MPISTFADYANKVASARRYHTLLGSPTYSSRSMNMQPNAAPATPVAPDKTSSLNIFLNDQCHNTSSTTYLAVIESFFGGVSGVSSVAILFDKLWTQGTFVVTTSTPQTVNSPAVALSRYTDGIGIMPVAHFLGSPGGAENITISYTNQDGVSGRTSQPIFPAGGLGSGTTYFFSLQDGDTGILSIESTTVGTSLPSSGSYNLALVKPLAILPMTNGGQADPMPYRDFLWGGGLIPVSVNACLELLLIGSGGVIGNTVVSTAYVETT